MRPPLEVIVSIARAVEAAGGDMDDVRDLVAVWERVQARTQPRADAMRREARTRPCVCADQPPPGKDGRCSRCYGQPKPPMKNAMNAGTQKPDQGETN